MFEHRLDSSLHSSTDAAVGSLLRPQEPFTAGHTHTPDVQSSSTEFESSFLLCKIFFFFFI